MDIENLESLDPNEFQMEVGVLDSTQTEAEILDPSTMDDDKEIDEL